MSLLTTTIVLATNAVDEEQPHEQVATVAALAVVATAVLTATATAKQDKDKENIVASASVIEHNFSSFSKFRPTQAVRTCATDTRP